MKTGVPFKYSGIVVPGRELGRKLGFPTANIAAGDDWEARDGVYAVKVRVGGQIYRGMANLGRRPSVDRTPGERVLEVNLFDYNGDLYGQTVEVELEKYVRPEMRFPDVEELKRTIEKDRTFITEYFKNQK